MEDRPATEEHLYNQLPVLGPEDIADNSVLPYGESYEELLVDSLVEALMDPGWIISADNEPQHLSEPSSRFRPPSENLKSWIKSLDQE